MSAGAEVTVAPIPRDDPTVRELYEAFIRESDGPLAEGPHGIDLEAEFADGPPADLAPPAGLLLIAYVDGVAVGLGGVRHLDTDVAEVKSMFVSASQRGRGVGRRLLAELEAIAAGHGCRAVRLDTSDYLTPAIALYRAAGYREVAAYNENRKANLWFERQL